MKTYEDVFGKKREDEHDLGPDFELREVRMWRVHCRHCGFMTISHMPQTDKSFAALKCLLERRQCRNPNCVSNGGTERKRRG